MRLGRKGQIKPFRPNFLQHPLQQSPSPSSLPQQKILFAPHSSMDDSLSAGLNPLLLLSTGP